MKLINMKLENFKGIRHLEISFNGLNRVFRGTNGAGKSTIADAQSWLLTGKKSDANENLDPKTIGPEGYIHNLEHSVECKYELDDRSLITLKKVFKEKYTKKRGSTTSEFSGHVVEYYMDDVPVKQKQFDEYLANIFKSAENILMLSNINYFANMDWKKRRKILLEMCGDYSDDYIIANNPELIELKGVLLKDGTNDQYYTVDEFMKMTKERMKKTNADIQMIPARIDEASRAIPDVSSLDKDSIQNQIDGIEAKINELNIEKLSLSSSDHERMKQERIHEIQMEIKDARIAFADEQSKKSRKAQENINLLSSKINDLQIRLSSIDSRKRNAENDMNYMINQRNKLLEEYKEVQMKEWDTSKEVCPTCGRELPAEQIDELKAKFNLDKHNKLTEINKRGQSVSKGAIEEQKAAIAKLDKEKEIAGSEIILYKKQLSKLEESKPKAELFENTEMYHVLNQKLQEAQNMIVDDLNIARKQELEDDISNLNEEKKLREKELSLFSTVDYQNKRIDELKKTQKILSENYENMEFEIHLCEEFIKTKVNMITENINQYFNNVRFKLFETQINGGLKECCDVMVPAKGGAYVPFNNGSNRGANMNAGIEMISVLSRYIGAELPVFVDNAESVVDLNSYDNMQIIKLVVDGNYKTLTMTE
ncbi:AAA family ATPase [Clostridium sp. C1]|uniref:AAA family ATPase n=1 Tax=Clostridium sp. C1 TaxID=1155388 RepID=UPI001BA7CECE|nr:ATP-binding protein [Clostridium sp. C1]QUN13652.1 AAA family ATPase [Clostridium sp. C1]